MSTADYFTHLRAIRSAEDRLRLLRAARSEYRRAVRAFLTQLRGEINRAETELVDAHTARIEGNDPCQRVRPLRLPNN